MRRNTVFTVLLSLFVLCATAYVITLHVTGYVVEGKAFATYAAGGLMTALIVMWLFGAFDRG